MGIRERQQRERDLLRQKILDAARELIKEEGYEKLTIRKIATRIEYSPMALYNHFADKSSILTALASESFEKITKIMPKPGGDPASMLRQALLGYIDFGLRHPDEYRFLFMTRRPVDGKVIPEFGSNSEPAGRKAFERLLEYIGAGLQTGAWSGDLMMLGRVIFAGIHGCVSLQLTLSSFPFGPPKEYAKAVVDLLMDGLISTQEAKPKQRMKK